jgi:hypothetical protein
MYLVTDLTRFKQGNPNVCTALLNMETGRCVRPMPYLTYDIMKKHGVVPGAKFDGNFQSRKDLTAPHLEDCDYSELKYYGPCTKDEFRDVLRRSAKPSVRAGFGIEIAADQKLLPATYKGSVSIVTISVDPKSLEIEPDKFTPTKIKAAFTDGAGHRFRFMPITDLGFFDFACKDRTPSALQSLNRHIQDAKEVLLRVGLSRVHTAPDGRCGYWIQVNGIYTFPSKLDVVRGYQT